MAPSGAIDSAIPAVRLKPAAPSASIAASAAIPIAANGAANEAARCTQLAVGPTSIAACARHQCCASFVLVGNCPICIRDVVPLEEAEPGVRRAKIQLSITVCITCSPLGGKHRNSARFCGIHSCPQLSPVRICIEVDRVGQIYTRHPVSGCLVNLLGPGSGPQDDDVLRVRADDRDDLLVVPLDGGPWDLQWLVVSFIEDIGVTGISLGHLIEKTLSLVCVLLSMMIMPVDDDVDARGDGCIDTSNHLILLVGVFHVASLVSSHGQANHSALPIRC